ncbi:hypothetical protein A6M21_11830 [Desulfotomaculum copahuensis]|uniref:Terminase large subunit gp17-like C-terminal domain-containing protein n=1 Tax=Desulfotomaculum copahuensis TaxID=1838280 RepID=A0A1B7LDJ2_9FIRM|nr:hypothetical protein A6M21_11830 [Desulfotomaculum copahuensis]
MAIWEADARDSLSFFLEYESAGEWKPANHLNLLCEKLEAIERGEIKRLIVEMPPRHGKSEVVSKKFPAWFLGRNPDKEVILTSYGADLTFDFSRIARDTFERMGPVLWGLELSPRSSAVGRWEIKGHRGGLTAAGIGGPITGRGAHVAIIDDPIKNWEEANSKTYREAVWNWYRTVLRTRLAPQGAIILVLTRWHEDDLAGRLLKEAKNGGEQWEVLRLPAVAEENDPLGRQPGEPLWPEYGFDATWAKETEKAVGSFVWAALYQQRPMPAEGGLFKRTNFRYFQVDAEWYTLHRPEGDKRVPKNACWVFQTCDPAGSTKTTADYFVLGTWAVTPDRELLLLDIIRERLEGPDQPRLFREGYRRYSPSFQGVETKNMGLTLYQMLLREGLPIRELKADSDKVTRALPAAARMEAGMIYFLEGAPWLDDYESELLAFPNGEHDDQVDITAYAAQQVAAGPQYEIY